MTWWCISTGVPWDWSFRAYPGVWAFVLAIAVSAVVIVRRSRTRLSGRQRLAGWGGLLVLWLASDWPIGALGSGYLSSVHMLQYFLYVFVAAPLLLAAVPTSLARRVLDAIRGERVYRAISRPLVAGIVANVVLLVTHSPLAVDALRASQIGSFGMDVLWLLSGVILWIPVHGPLPELRRSYPLRAVYLFLAAGVLPMIPGGFLTFSDYPLYSIYELAPRVGGIDPIADQRAAGAVMKIGSIPVVWSVMAVMFWRWYEQDRARPPSARMPAGPRMPAGQGATTVSRPV